MTFTHLLIYALPAPPRASRARAVEHTECNGHFTISPDPSFTVTDSDGQRHTITAFSDEVRALCEQLAWALGDSVDYEP